MSLPSCAPLAVHNDTMGRLPQAKVAQPTYVHRLPRRYEFGSRNEERSRLLFNVSGNNRPPPDLSPAVGKNPALPPAGFLLIELPSPSTTVERLMLEKDHVENCAGNDRQSEAPRQYISHVTGRFPLARLIGRKHGAGTVFIRRIVIGSGAIVFHGDSTRGFARSSRKAQRRNFSARHRSGKAASHTDRLPTTDEWLAHPYDRTSPRSSVHPMPLPPSGSRSGVSGPSAVEALGET